MENFVSTNFHKSISLKNTSNYTKQFKLSSRTATNVLKLQLVINFNKLREDKTLDHPPEKICSIDSSFTGDIKGPTRTFFGRGGYF